MRIRVEKDKIMEVSLIFIECGMDMEQNKKFFYLEMQPVYSGHERKMYKFSDPRKNAYVDEYEMLMDMLLEKGYLDFMAHGLEEIEISD